MPAGFFGKTGSGTLFFFPLRTALPIGPPGASCLHAPGPCRACPMDVDALTAHLPAAPYKGAWGSDASISDASALDAPTPAPAYGAGRPQHHASFPPPNYTELCDTSFHFRYLQSLNERANELPGGGIEVRCGAVRCSAARGARAGGGGGALDAVLLAEGGGESGRRAPPRTGPAIRGGHHPIAPPPPRGGAPCNTSAPLAPPPPPPSPPRPPPRPLFSDWVQFFFRAFGQSNFVSAAFGVSQLTPEFSFGAPTNSAPPAGGGGGGGGSTAPAHQRLGSANAETTPAGAPAAAADRTQRPDATCEGKNG